MDPVSALILAIVPTIGFVGVGFFAVARFDLLVREVFDRQQDEVKPPVASFTSITPEGLRQAMPEHVAMIALVESEPWAQEQVMKAMNELYEETGDWAIVARTFSGSHA